MANKNENNLKYRKHHQYGIRKFKVGIASVMFASFFYINIDYVAQAAESEEQETTSINQKLKLQSQMNEMSENAATDNQETIQTVSDNLTTPSVNTQDEVTHQSTSEAAFKENIVDEKSSSTNLNQTPEKSDAISGTSSQRAETERTPSSNEKIEEVSESETSVNHLNTVESDVNDKMTTTSGKTAFREAQNGEIQANTSLDAGSSTPTQQPAPQARATEVKIDGINESVYQKSIPVKQHPKTAQTLGMNRGIGQGRESLGLILPANTNLYIRQSLPQNEGDIRVSLVTDDSQQNKSKIVPKDGQWVSISTAIDSGAFVYFPRGFNNEPQVEYYVENNLGRTLPTYYKGDNQSVFEQQWKDENASYAFVEGAYTAFLIPNVDRSLVEKMKDTQEVNAFKTLDAMLNYYDDVIQKYNEWSGLNEDPESIHYNVEQKYFTMADKNGFGLAYWSWDHMGSNQPSLSGYLQPGWLSLHEIGHGFDGWMIGDGRMELVEIWNNIFGNEYQTNVLGVEKGWLYQGNQEAYQKQVHDKLLNQNENFSFNKANARERLDFMTRMVRLTTIEGVTNMLKSMREEAAQGNVNKDVPRWIIEHWLADKGYNGIAYFDLYQIPLPKNVIDEVNASQHSYIYPLAMLIENDAEREKYKNQLGLSTIYELVKSSDIQDTTVDSHGSVRVNLNGHVLPEGSQIKLIDAKQLVAVAPIQDQKAIFEHVRPGVYQIIAPLSKDYALPEHAYLVVSENGTNEVTLNYPKLQSSQSTLTQHISLRGLGNREFVGIDYNPFTKEVTYTQTAIEPHSYFNDEYAHVTIKNQQGEIVWDQSYIGNQSQPNQQHVYTMQYGDTIQIKHREAKTRRKVIRIENSTEMSLPLQEQETVTYQLTDKGLIVLNETQEAAETRYAEQIQNDVNEIIETIKQNPDKDFRTPLYRLVQGVQYVQNPEKEQLMNQLTPYLVNDLAMNTPEPTVTSAEIDYGEVTGSGPIQSTITVTFPSGRLGETMVMDDGNWSVAIPENEQFNPGDVITVVATEIGKFPSSTVTVPVTDTVVPQTVSVDPLTEYSKVISGDTVPGTTVEVRFPNYQKLTTVSSDGKWSIMIPDNIDLTSNDRLYVTAIDRFGNRSIIKIVRPYDVTAPKMPTVTATEAGQHIVWGTGETYKNRLEVRLPNGTMVPTKVGRNLTWMIGVPFDTELKVGDQILVTEIDEYGNRSQPGVGKVVDTTAPQSPTVTNLIEGDTKLSGFGESGSQIIVQLPTGQILKTVVLDDGTWHINEPVIADILPDSQIIVSAQDESGNMSAPAKVVVLSKEVVEEPTGETSEPEIEESTGETPESEVEEPTDEASESEVEEVTDEASEPEVEEVTGEASEPEVEEPTGETPETEVEEATGETPEPEVEESTVETSEPEVEEQTIETSETKIDGTSEKPSDHSTSNVGVPIDANSKGTTEDSYQFVNPLESKANEKSDAIDSNVNDEAIVSTLGEVEKQIQNSNKDVQSAYASIPSSKKKVLPNTGQSESLDWKAILLASFGFGLLIRRFSKREKKQ